MSRPTSDATIGLTPQGVKGRYKEKKFKTVRHTPMKIIQDRGTPKKNNFPNDITTSPKVFREGARP